MSFGLLMAIVATLAWGIVVIPVKRAETPGVIGVGISMPVGTACLAIASLALMKDYSWTRSLWSKTGLLLACEGLFQFALATMFYYESVKRAELSRVVPLTRLKAVFVAALVFIFGLETLTGNTIAACVIGVVGAFVLTMGGKKGGQRGTTDRDTFLGMVFALLACLSWAVGDIFVKLIGKAIPPLAMTLVSLAMGTAIYYAYVLLTGKIKMIWAVPRRDKWLYASHGFLSFAVAYGAFFAAIDMLGVTRSVIVTTTWPLVSCVIGFLVFKEKLTWSKAIGGNLLIGSVLIALI